ncbi:hypothetical protein CDL12_06638 [Handroanthus impetiginosus]|uniref:H15 domain-containing protein n=1 Tax=Handroanthus impetiginosus TaxID=429701 RepID=A0A2G9HT11_9LAMI|nr:hypothetical protein CDL12_06638 [Handroanthus impetiginosus]
MGANHGQGCRGNALTSKGKAAATGVVPPKRQNSSSGFVSKGNVNDKPSQNPQDVKSALRYNALILEAISSIKDRNGSDFGAIMGFIEKKYEVPQRFRRLLSSKLTKLVSQGTLEKVKKRYKIKRTALGTKIPTPKQKDVRSRPSQESRLTISAETLEEAAKLAAYKIAEAENKSFVAAEAVKEFERVSQMAEEADTVLMRLKDIFEQWEDKGDENSKSSPVEVILVV